LGTQSYLYRRPAYNLLENMLGLGEKCFRCGKKLGKDKVERMGKKFCCESCMKQYGKEHPPKNPNVCEFC